MARGDLAKARELIDHSITLLPKMVWSRLMLVEWLFKSNAPSDDRIAACRDVLRLAPGNVWAAAKLAEAQRPERSQEVSPSWFTITVG